MIETMRLLLKHITLNQQITLAETFHTYFTTFQIAAPRRITKRFIKSQKTSENQRFPEVFILCLYPKSAQYIAISSVQEGSIVFEALFAPSLWIVRYFSAICIN